MTRNFDQSPIPEMPNIARRQLDVDNPSLIRASAVAPDKPFPLIVSPALGGLDAIKWAKDSTEFIESELSQRGALLFRGFDIDTAARFEGFVKAISGEAIEYRERSSPRSRVADRIYTSTDYPTDQVIFPHNEHSYAKTFALKLYFFCAMPAAEGGETPLADCRRVLQRIDPRIRERFIQKKWMYVRNFGDGFGLSWRKAFQTEDKGMVEAYCRAADIQVEWKDRDRLRTRQVRPAVIRHPRTGELSWFNHATFFHISTLPPLIKDELLADFEEEDLPNNTYYGDGSRIEGDVLDELRSAYKEELVTFRWEQGDVILLDNIAIAHARNRYSGPRQIFFAMADAYSRDDI